MTAHSKQFLGVEQSGHLLLCGSVSTGRDGIALLGAKGVCRHGRHDTGDYLSVQGDTMDLYLSIRVSGFETCTGLAMHQTRRPRSCCDGTIPMAGRSAIT